MNLIDNLIQEGWLKTPRIIEAFRIIKRVDFMPAAPIGGEPRPLYGREDVKNLAELNEALPIGKGQTISQPLVVAFMLEQLQPELGDNILDVGSGSGWTSALLAHCVSNRELNEKLKIKNEKPKGKIIAIEAIPELKTFGEDNVRKYNYIKKGIAGFICADGTKGYEKEAPFDKILCSAAVQKEVPRAWKEQLKIGGRIVTPVGSSIWLIIKKNEKDFEETEFPGFSFVPLIQK